MDHRRDGGTTPLGRSVLLRTFFKSPSFSETVNTQQSRTFWGPTVVAQDYFWYHYFIRSRSTLAAKAVSEAILRFTQYNNPSLHITANK
jgi:hypothetical protein